MEISEEWEKKYWKRVFSDLKEANIELTKENIPKILEEMSFKVRSKKYPSICPCYSTGQSCHPNTKNLNCMLCACP